MPKKCCIANCRIEQDDPVGRHESFFKIPNDENEKKKWLDNISKEIKNKLTKYSYVCSLHFEKDSYTYTDGNVRRIKKGCYPTIFTDFKSRKQDALQQCIDNIDKDNSSANINHMQDEMEFYNDSTIAILSAKETPDESKEYVQDKNNSFENEDVNVLKQGHECDSSSPNCLTDNSISKNEENSHASDCLQFEETFKRSLANVDCSSIAFTAENLPKLKKLIFKAQREVTDLRRRLKANRIKIYRYKKKTNGVKSLLSELKQKKFITNQVSEVLEATVPDHTQALIQRLLQRNSKSRIPFPPSLKSFTTTLHFYSLKAYNYVRNSFLKCLPHPKTVGNWYRRIKCKSGINEASLKAIKRKVEEYKSKNENHPLLGNLVFDEMKIKSQIDIVNEREYGYIDVGTGVDKDEVPKAENVFVLMLVAENDSWKIPVSFYFINSLTGSEKAVCVQVRP